EHASSAAARKPQHAEKPRALERTRYGHVVQRFERLAAHERFLAADAPRVSREPEQEIAEPLLELVEAEQAAHEAHLIETQVEQPDRKLHELLLRERAAPVEVVAAFEVGVVQAGVVA